MASNEIHTRTSTDCGPDYCAECSTKIQEWVSWPCSSNVASNENQCECFPGCIGYCQPTDNDEQSWSPRTKQNSMHITRRGEIALVIAFALMLIGAMALVGKVEHNGKETGQQQTQYDTRFIQD